MASGVYQQSFGRNSSHAFVVDIPQEHMDYFAFYGDSPDAPTCDHTNSTGMQQMMEITSNKASCLKCYDSNKPSRLASERGQKLFPWFGGKKAAAQHMYMESQTKPSRQSLKIPDFCTSTM